MSEEKTVNMPTPPEVAEAHWAILYVENRQFREDFDKDPRATLGRLTGEEVPDEVEIVIHRRKGNEIHLVLPETTDAAADLSAEQLGMVVAAAGCGRHDGGSYRPVIDYSTGRPVYEHSGTGPSRWPEK